ncbi:hypothetical protein [Clostridium amazonitimonense]|uniref:hypothetical protein n=1 Tax=Clostridium amazonitimonense TaxID=1499689 RepID=UPI000509801A|nr:hypothetical protein [Clostridium amazonitimonense]
MFTNKQIETVINTLEKEITEATRISKRMKKAIVENVEAALELANMHEKNDIKNIDALNKN